MTIHDRSTIGILAGTAAGLITKAYDLLAHYFGISTMRWMDFSGIMLFGYKPQTLTAQILATLGMLFFHAGMAITFVYFIKPLTSKNLLLKGWFFGTGLWFAIYAIFHLFKVPEMASLPIKTVASSFAGATVWGLSMAMIINWLENKVKL